MYGGGLHQAVLLAESAPRAERWIHDRPEGALQHDCPAPQGQALKQLRQMSPLWARHRVASMTAVPIRTGSPGSRCSAWVGQTAAQAGACPPQRSQAVSRAAM